MAKSAKSRKRKTPARLTNSSKIKDQTTEYAKAVVDGKIIAGELVRLAADRHLRDLEDGPKRGLSWDVNDAERAIRFFPAMLTVTEGEMEGKPFTLLPWHLFVVGSLFGWKDVNGLRRFRFVWLETGKGQAKSPLMAAIGIYLQGFCKIRRAEIYCIGEVRDTAKVMFRDVTAMLKSPIPNRGGETLLDGGRFKIRGTGDNAYKVEHPASDSTLQPIANTDSVSGPKPIAVMGDEIHEMKTNKAITIWQAAITKKSGDPVMILGTNTPSVDQLVGTEYAEYFQKVLRQEFTDDSAFAYIARVDKGDDPLNDESCWIKSLPALGVTYPVENVRKIVETSKQMLSTALTTKRLYFGIPVGTAGFWISEDAWESTQGEIDIDDMKGRKLHLALDLSQKNDLSALSGCWEGEELNVRTWYYTREYEIAERTTADKIPYRELQESGELTINSGRVIDYSFIADQVRRLTLDYDVVQLAVDAAYIEDFVKACDEMAFEVWLYEGPDEPEGVGLKIVRHAQGKRVVFEEKALCMPVSIRHLEDHILKGTITIERNRLTTICASNTVIDADAQKNKMFDKKRSRGRIDGMVTIAMSVGSATAHMEAEEVSSPMALVM